ncbi:MAG: hypothetical protein ABI846_15725 [Rudaea sp.]
MIFRVRTVAVAVALAFGLAACSPRLAGYRGYHGDGVFVAHAAPSVICPDGYTVDLGEVDLTRVGTTRFTLDGLPTIESTIGLAVSAPADAATARWPAAEIQLTLRNEASAIVLSRHEALVRWTRSYALDDPAHAFLYQRGTQIEVAAAPGSVRVERFPIGPDDSWGTYLTPRRGARYTLHFEVETPDAAVAGASARLQVRGVVGCL